MNSIIKSSSASVSVIETVDSSEASPSSWTGKLTKSRPTRTSSRRGTDRLVLDVGGTLFTTSKSTLRANSHYFEALLSARWHNNDDDDYDDEPIFVDREPEPFAILLTYMRNGHIQLPRHDPKLCELVMLQAQYLGVTGFLATVKATAFMNLFPTFASDNKTITRFEVADEFDKLYGPIEDAIDNGILPRCFFPPNETLEIRVHDRIFHASKKILVLKSAYFRKLLTESPQDYWKKDHVLCENPDVFELVLQHICARSMLVMTILEKASEHPDRVLQKEIAKRFLPSVLKRLKYFGAVSAEQAATFQSDMDAVLNMIFEKNREQQQQPTSL